jgi:hypothetical protein
VTDQDQNAVPGTQLDRWRLEHIDRPGEIELDHVGRDTVALR